MRNNRLQWHCQRLKYRQAPSPLFENLHFTLPLNHFTCLLGQSGCGKSTLLRFLCGLLDLDIDWQGRLESPIPLENNVAYMGQQDLLLPWLSVRDNAQLQQKFPQCTPNISSNVDEILEKLGLSAVADHKPSQLSGGMRQRVALARTLMQNKPFVFMDEPFSALDAITRQSLQTLTSIALKNKTVLLITHDPLEALKMGDHIQVMQSNRIRTLSLQGKTPRPLTPDLFTHQETLIHWLNVEAKNAYVPE